MQLLEKNMYICIWNSEQFCLPSAETILTWIWPYVLWPLVTGHTDAETIRGNTVLKKCYSEKMALLSIPFDKLQWYKGMNEEGGCSKLACWHLCQSLTSPVFINVKNLSNDVIWSQISSYLLLPFFSFFTSSLTNNSGCH